ncbi:hypothetical protein CK203_042134 [Vitis vinifera]|uniref:Uncharacterized protein n=1 Tax=Vitis vinifera TaxID=29760 RepID=A0A438HPY6_VITVI|nr:hypothetical protein CK203_042134 [Vitis vinifera]
MVENVLTVGAPNIPEKTCLKLIRYPDWWNDFQARKKRDDVAIAESTSRAVVANAEPQLSFLSQLKLPNDPTPPHNQGNCGHVLLSSTPHDGDVWIIDSRAIDHMTFDSNDFTHITQPRPCISNANGVTYPIIGAGIDILTKNITRRGTKRGGLYYMDDFSAGELTSCTTQPVTRRDKFSYCTVAWGTHHLAI